MQSALLAALTSLLTALTWQLAALSILHGMQNNAEMQVLTTTPCATPELTVLVSAYSQHLA